jgi:hypothetical protein
MSVPARELATKSAVFSPLTRKWREIMRYGLLWLLGVPIPVLILIYFLFN